MPTIPQPPDRFGDELVELREIAAWDIPEVLIAHQDDPDLHRRLGRTGAPTGAELGREVERAGAERLSGNSVKLAILEPGNSDCRGRVEIDDIDWERSGARVRVWAAPQVRGRGYEQRAADITCEWLRGAVGLEHLNVTIVT